jgi:hypothetical protein
MATANTLECIEEFKGQALRGVLTGNRKNAITGVTSTKTLIFEDGRGLTFSSNGSYWTESAEEIAERVKKIVGELERAGESARRTLEAIGENA